MSSLDVEIQKTDRAIKLTLTGSINEDSDMPTVNFSAYTEIQFELKGVRSINSYGIRTWLKWISTIPTDAKLVFSNCPKVFIDQANMITGFIPKGGVVHSFDVPYFCEACDEVTTRSYILDELIVETLPCIKCQEAAELDISPKFYLKFKTGT
jgi:hypothetical protein